MQIVLGGVMLLAGALWLARGTADFSGDARDPLLPVALFSLAPALLALERVDAGRSGLFGRLGAFAGAAGAVAAGIGGLGQELFAIPAFGVWLILPGLAVFALGLLAFIIGLTSAAPPWQRLTSLLVAMLVGLFGVSLGGGFLFGGAWLALGALLLAQRGPFRSRVA